MYITRTKKKIMKSDVTANFSPNNTNANFSVCFLTKLNLIREKYNNKK